MGEHDIRNKTDCFYTKFGAECADPPVYIDVESTVIHKLFDRRFASNDIGLVRLSKEVTFTGTHTKIFQNIALTSEFIFSRFH